MLRLVKTHLSAAGQAYGRFYAPTLFPDWPAGDILILQHFYRYLQVVAHKVQLRAEHRMFIFPATFLRRMQCGFRGRELKNQPTMSRVNRFQSQDVAEKISIGLRIRTEQ